VNLFDASALLCFLHDENGAAVVERELLAGGCCSAVNWSETAQKLLAHGQDWPLARGLLLSYGLVVEPVSAEDAECAARLWRHGSGLSLADRIAIATAHRLGATVWTADQAWGSQTPIRQVR
jgi:ribonuclease VapC